MGIAAITITIEMVQKMNIYIESSPKWNQFLILRLVTAFE